MLPITQTPIRPLTPVSTPVTLNQPVTQQPQATQTGIKVRLDPVGNPIIIDGNGQEVRGLISTRGNKYYWTTADGMQGTSPIPS
jgi:hypothetical protein